MAEPSFKHLLPTFQIPIGTQVVLKVDKHLSDGVFKPRSTVAVVVESPRDNRDPYTIRFADGSVGYVLFSDLAMRRREIEDEFVLTGHDLRPFIIYQCRVGSRAFGLSNADSDDDLRGIYLPPARLTWSLFKVPEQLEFQDDEKDEVYWELEKFLKLALKANPNVLETLWTPHVLIANEVAKKLLELREAFLSKHLYKTYSGYVLSQFRRMTNAVEKTGTYRAKHAMHLIRLLYSGIAALESGEIRVDVAEHREELLHVKTGALSFEQARQRALELDQRFQDAFLKSRLPEQPDYRRVDAFLLWARRQMVDS